MLIVGVFTYLTVAQVDVSAAVFGNLRVMGNEDDGVSLTVELLKQHKHLERGSCVQVTRCFVSQQHGRVVDQRPGYGYALHLSARHLVRLMFQAVAKPYGLQGLDGPLAALRG